MYKLILCDVPNNSTPNIRKKIKKKPTESFSLDNILMLQGWKKMQ